MKQRLFMTGVAAALVYLMLVPIASAGEKKKKGEFVQTPENTIRVELVQPVKPQTFLRPIKFWVSDVVDRSGNPQPLLVGPDVFLDREPTVIVRQALEDSCKAADILAADSTSADYSLRAFVFSFGLAPSAEGELFAKVELNVVVKNQRSGKSHTVTALGTSIMELDNQTDESSNLKKEDFRRKANQGLDEALQDALRNLLHGTKLREAVTLESDLLRPVKAGRSLACLRFTSGS
jgi:hypothetical protein